MDEYRLKPDAQTRTRSAGRCIIHIGMNKTGSTSIQRSLKIFEDDHFMYARLGNRANHSFPIYSLFASDPERHRSYRVAARRLANVDSFKKVVWKELDSAVSALQGRALLISGEFIASLPETDMVKLRQYFETRFDGLTIVGYVRPPAGYMISSFQQRVKSGGLAKFDLTRMYRSYQFIFGKFDRIFGRDNVLLWKFDPKVFPESCVVRDFCARLGISLPTEKIIRMNDSLSRQAVTALYAYNKFSKNLGANPFSGAESGKIRNILRGDKFRLSPDILLPVLEQHRSDIEWMEARLGQSLQEDFAEHEPSDPRSEADLLRPNPEITRRLLAELGSSAPPGVKGDMPRDVAHLIHALRQKIATSRDRGEPTEAG
jgi:hypothetical protein